MGEGIMEIYVEIILILWSIVLMVTFLFSFIKRIYNTVKDKTRIKGCVKEAFHASLLFSVRKRVLKLLAYSGWLILAGYAMYSPYFYTYQDGNGNFLHLGNYLEILWGATVSLFMVAVVLVGIGIIFDVYVWGTTLLMILTGGGVFIGNGGLFIGGGVGCPLPLFGGIVVTILVWNRKKIGFWKAVKQYLCNNIPLTCVVAGTLIALNLWYIMTPKHTFYAYVTSDLYGRGLCMIDDTLTGCMDASADEMNEYLSSKEMVEWYDTGTEQPSSSNAAAYAEERVYISSPGDEPNLNGYRIRGLREGETTVTLISVKWGRNGIREETVEIPIRVDKHLKIHFDMDFTYVKRVYYLNLYTIALCTLWLLVTFCVLGCRRQNNCH